MRRILALSIMLSFAAEGGAQDYCEEYEEGYEAGWCSDYHPSACPPAPPSGCMNGGGKSSRDAWERGYHQGEADEDYEVAPESQDD